jgi:hypothetical protein
MILGGGPFSERPPKYRWDGTISFDQYRSFQLPSNFLTVPHEMLFEEAVKQCLKSFVDQHIGVLRRLAHTSRFLLEMNWALGNPLTHRYRAAGLLGEAYLTDFGSLASCIAARR